MTVQTPHDALFKHTFSNPQYAAAQLRAVLPPSLVAKINWTSLECLAGTFVDQEFSETHSDLLFSATIRAKPSLIYLLFEHQSSVDKIMPFRVLKYIVRALEAHLAREGDALPLPLIVPLVLHHSERGWTAATSIQELFDPELVADPDLVPFIPHLRFVLDDISHLSDEQLYSRAAQLFPRIILWAMRDARDQSRMYHSLEIWASALEDLARGPSGRDAFIIVLRYIALVADIPAKYIIDVIARLAPTPKDSLMTIAQQWIDEGFEKGIEKGRVEGRAGILVDQLSIKFGPIDADVRARVFTASEIELARWTVNILRANSLAEALS
jgi:predicted transposase/invertase (TIGR01784 family)